MHKKIAICPGCHTKITCEGEPGEKVKVECPSCGRAGSILFKSEFIQNKLLTLRLGVRSMKPSLRDILILIITIYY